MVPTRHAHRTEKNFRSVTERNVKLTPLFGAELPPGGSRSPKIKIKIKAKRHKIALGAPIWRRPFIGMPDIDDSVHGRWFMNWPKKKCLLAVYLSRFFFVVRSKRGHLHNWQTNRFFFKKRNHLPCGGAEEQKVLPIWSKVGDLIIYAFVARSSGKGRADAKNNSI